jgi:hypothetical protein
MMLAILLFGLINVAPQEGAPTQASSRCMQSASEQKPLLREAITNRYTVRRVEFTGNETIRDQVLRRRVSLREGNFFDRKNLAKSLVALNKLKMLYPLKMNDVIVRLDKPDKLMDITFCFRERHPHRPDAPANKALQLTAR